jgi:hypothetical protein
MSCWALWTGCYLPTTERSGSRSGSGASVDRARRKPDVTLDVRELGSIYLGGVSLNDLHRAGLIEERRKGAIATVAAAFGWTRPPLTPDHF